jgi:GNAT superfamily N-acetyltransferase
VARPSVLTRTANKDDLSVLLLLWDELREVGGRAERAVNPITAVDVGSCMLALLDDPGYRVVLAFVSDVPAGMAIMRVTSPDPLSGNQLVYVAHLVVSRPNRHKGVGHALLSAAVDYASARQVDHVSVAVYPSLRETNRFYARLGFAPAAVHRIAPVSVLRRRLGTDRGGSLLADSVRRRSRSVRQVPTQRVRPTTSERVDS